MTTTPFRTSVEQADPPRSQVLPTMYDLPSEAPEEPGLPDEFHDLQPHLLSATFKVPDHAPDQIFTGTNLYLYYDAHHQLWQKRPDWFAAVGVPRLYDGHDLRLSYVIWQEEVVPSVVVELLSPGTEKEDLGKTEAKQNAPPTKWEVYEQILQIPYYVVFDRYSDVLRAWQLQGGQYQEFKLTEPRIWLSKLKLGLGLWQGAYEGINRLWLRWYQEGGDWILTGTEAAQQAQQQAQAQAQQAENRAKQAEHRAEQLAARLKALGIDSEL